ncbi:hypothetical protein [Streptomyces sp. NPDC056401]|uniref:hypothetical protein n=1 Tax=Streptomyces sp. NPDC056401 TaxID=3345809 RepID=UPI0035E16317
MPALVIRSTARRARETWALTAGQLGAEVPARFDERVYAAIAALSRPGSWQELAPGSARLTDFAVPRGAAR